MLSSTITDPNNVAGTTTGGTMGAPMQDNNTQGAM